MAFETRAPAGDLPCAPVVALITDYLDDTLAPAQRTRLEVHLFDCDGCTAVLDQFRATIAATRQLATDDVGRLDELPRADLLGVFRRWADDRPIS